MRKIPNSYEKVPVKNILKRCKTQNIKMQIIEHFKDLDNAKRSITSSVRALDDISKIYDEELWVEKLKLYLSSTSQKEKVSIRKGKVGKLDYEKRLKERNRPKGPFSIFSYEFWVNKGYSIEDAKLKVSKIQKENQQKRSYKDTKIKYCKHSIDYWTYRGYNKNEAEVLRRPYLDKMRNDEQSLIKKYGKEKGKNIYKRRIEKYKDSCKKNYHNKKRPGYVSKESLKFFIPLYKKCRKLGLSRKDIYLGVNGSREFFIRRKGVENSGRFFDFCIPSLNLIIEYNGTFWHPRTPELWRNPWVNYDDAVAIDLERYNLCESRGFDLFVVWSDDDLNAKLNEIVKEVAIRYERKKA